MQHKLSKSLSDAGSRDVKIGIFIQKSKVLKPNNYIHVSTEFQEITVSSKCLGFCPDMRRRKLRMREGVQSILLFQK